MFTKLVMAPADPILGLTDSFNSDLRSNKVNLGVGVYKDETGVTPILDTVKQAEQLLLQTEKTKSYLAIQGSTLYNQTIQTLLFGENSLIILENRAYTAQAPGGTGALRIASEFIVRQLKCNTIWISNPTWANHNQLFESVGLTIKTYRYYDADTKALPFDLMMADLEQAQEGDVVLLHACCHNPSGIDPTFEQWQKISELCLRKRLLPLFDFAYQGFATGVDEDAMGLRFFATQHPQLLIASSCSKNFGLYNERVGAFTLMAPTSKIGAIAFSQVKRIIRVIYSNPPAHGANIVATILSEPKLKQQWLAEVSEMRNRIKEMRHLFVDTLNSYGLDQDFEFIKSQNGMFSFSGLTKNQVEKLQVEFAVYIVGSGRISVAGMTQSNMPILCDAIAKVIKG